MANPDFVAEAADKFGNQCIVVSIDSKKVSAEGEEDRWEIFTHGGRHATRIVAAAFLVGLNWLVFIWAVNSNHVVEASLGYFINPLLNIVLGVLIYVLIWVALLPLGLGMIVLIPVLAGTLHASYQDVFGERPALPPAAAAKE